LRYISQKLLSRGRVRERMDSEKGKGKKGEEEETGMTKKKTRLMLRNLFSGTEGVKDRKVE